MTKIEWTDQTWNPIVGCQVLSAGCTNCYAMKMADRLGRMATKPDGSGNPHLLHYEGLTECKGRLRYTPVWTGKVDRAQDFHWQAPLRRQKPTMYFVCSMGDLFYEGVPDEWIDQAFAIMALASRHIFQVLTKRPQRMLTYIASLTAKSDRMAAFLGRTIRTPDQPDGARVFDLIAAKFGAHFAWPLPNVWIGTSAEDQRAADERVPALIATPAAVRFVSAEPLLGPVSLDRAMFSTSSSNMAAASDLLPAAVRTGPAWQPLHWVIAGGESGVGARPTHPAWVRTLRDEAERAGRAFFFKQWGTWKPLGSNDGDWPTSAEGACRIDRDGHRSSAGWPMQRLGKKDAGRLLDGRIHDAMPGSQMARAEATEVTS